VVLQVSHEKLRQGRFMEACVPSNNVCKVQHRVRPDGLYNEKINKNKNKNQEHCKEEQVQWKAQCRYEEYMMAVSTHACDIQEHTTLALLDILYQSLLAPSQ